ncbi:SDR family NAD(P)-dependent oxidoreductase [Celeribacter arenosi]|uniref:SDR family NAD(P)-dependent oxidoreductase n=1 Tax=Celeribacter arenosi TaxID=792649 RepID=A0ABP7K079_9RHOB
MRSILITGCSSGIGYDAAITLSNAGWRVFATCRRVEDCETLRARGLESCVLDYEKPETINAALEYVFQQTGGTLDALFNNGAYAIPGALEDVPPDAMRAIFEANFLGWHDLTRRVVPVMRAQGHGRIVQCSSVLGLITAPWRGAYVATKFALEGYTDTLRQELRGAGIHVSLIEPGPIRTAFRKNARIQFDRWIDWESSSIADLYRNTLVNRLYAAEGTPDRFELGAESVTRAVVRALEAPRPKARYRVTLPTHAAAIAKRLLPTRWLDRLSERA